MAINMTTAVRPMDHVFAEQIGDELILLDSETEKYLSIDAIGAAIWGQLKSRSTIGEVVEQLTTEYAADRTVIERDVLAFVDRLADLGLVALQPGEQPSAH